jgi:hypothetical protein
MQNLNEIGNQTLESEGLDHLIGHVRYGLSSDKKNLKVMPVTQYATELVGQYLEFGIGRF